MPVNHTYPDNVLEFYNKGPLGVYYRTKDKEAFAFYCRDNDSAKTAVELLNKLIEMGLNMGHQPCVVNKEIVKIIKGD